MTVGDLVRKLLKYDQKINLKIRTVKEDARNGEILGVMGEEYDSNHPWYDPGRFIVIYVEDRHA